MHLDPASAGLSRRGLLLSGTSLLALPHALPRQVQAAVAARPVLDQPMRRLRLPAGTLGRDYVLLQLRLGNRGPFDFMVDTGLTAELITPHLRQVLGIPPANKVLAQGLGAGGAVPGGELVQLKDVRIEGAEDVSIPPLTAVVTDFLQEHLDPAHDPVEGMLGMELLQLFDLDLDFPAERIRLYHPGDGTAAAESAGLVPIPAAVLNETGVLGIRVTSPSAEAATGGKAQPFAGMLDCGASFSALNWQAAALAGLPPRGDAGYGDPSRTGVAIVGVDGRPQLVPTTHVQFTFVGNVQKKEGSALQFELPPPRWQPWQSVRAAVGDLPAFSQLFGDGRTPFTGPAALIGLDVLAQRRVVVGAGVGVRGRARQLWVSAA